MVRTLLAAHYRSSTQEAMQLEQKQMVNRVFHPKYYLSLCLLVCLHKNACSRPSLAGEHARGWMKWGGGERATWSTLSPLDSQGDSGGRRIHGWQGCPRWSSCSTPPATRVFWGPAWSHTNKPSIALVNTALSKHNIHWTVPQTKSV